MLDNDILSPAQLDDIRAAAQETIREAVQFADESPYPETDTLIDGVYA